MKSDELLDQVPTVDKTTEDEMQAFLRSAAHKPAETAESLPIKEPNPLPPEPAITDQQVSLGPGTVNVVDEKKFQEDLDSAEKALDLLKMAPAERYRAILEREGVTLDEARQIIDCLVVKLEPFEKRYFLSKTMSVVFKTRSQEDQERFNKVLETERPQYDATVRTHIVTYNLASSLVRYGKQTFARETDDDFASILRWISKIPSPTYVLLSRRLSEFDELIDLVFQEGWLENF